MIYEILGVPFLVEWADLASNTLGDCDCFVQRIRLSTRLLEDKEKARQVLRHEIVHAIMGVSGWGKALDDEQEEGLVTMFEYGLGPFFIDLKLPPKPEKKNAKTK